MKVIGDELSLATPEKIRTPQRKLYCKAKAEPISASNAGAAPQVSQAAPDRSRAKPDRSKALIGKKLDDPISVPVRKRAWLDNDYRRAIRSHVRNDSTKFHRFADDPRPIGGKVMASLPKR